MAVVILGGLVTTALMSLAVVPSLYLRYGGTFGADATAEDLVVQIPDVDTVQGAGASS
jgi:hypothetical protein